MELLIWCKMLMYPILCVYSIKLVSKPESPEEEGSPSVEAAQKSELVKTFRSPIEEIGYFKGKLDAAKELGYLKGKLEEKNREIERISEEKNREIERKSAEKNKVIKEQQSQIRKFKAAVWRVAPRVYIDDVEAKLKPCYDQFRNEMEAEEKRHRSSYDAQTGRKLKYSPIYSTPGDWSNDPKSARIRKRKDMWIWFLENRENDYYIKDILSEIEAAFRKEQPSIPPNVPLNDQYKAEFQIFKEKCCEAIGFVHEKASFLIHGGEATELINGTLNKLNVFGPQVDPYLLPILKALIPYTDPNESPVG